MNFLAHAFLAEDTPESILGNLAGDFFKGRVDHHPVELREGIRRHRAVDAFTDSHEIVSRSKVRIRPLYGHIAPVVLDVFHDHLLALNFGAFTSATLEEFLSRVYSAIDSHGHLLNPAASIVMQKMRAEDWLASYADLEGIRTALYFMSRRFRVNPHLDQKLGALLEHREDLEKEFLEFFPELIRHVSP